MTTTDEQYVPDEMDARGCFLDGAAGAFVREDWEASLARARRDAKRCAIDELIADKAHVTVLLRAENGGEAEDVLAHFRDAHYPGEAP
ncbi:hypothetical protein ACFWQK_09265 [Brachybacterium paraconglomeratum]